MSIHSRYPGGKGDVFSMGRIKAAGGVCALTLVVWLAAGAATASASGPRTASLTTSVLTFTSTAPAAVVGGPTYTPAASISPAVSLFPDQLIGFVVDPATTNSACAIGNDIVSFQHAGSCVIDAEVTADTVTADLAQQTITVSPAGTATSLVIGPSTLTATVATIAPGSGTATGTVLFTVGGRALGSASLVNGVATLNYTVPPNVTEAILASYQGDADYTTSSATVTANGLDIEPTFVARPTIAARVTSTASKNSHGWWHTAVTIHFVCDAAGSSVDGGCPRPLVLTQSSADLSVSRTIRTAVGTTATVALRGIKIDLTKPKVEIVGVRNHALYHGSKPPVSCAATDPVSGIASCKVITNVKRSSTMATITYTAVATTGAGVTERTTETIYSKL
jgi:Bacterial Ig-like domain (group 3)